MDDIYNYLNSLSIPLRLVVFTAVAVATHVVVILVRQSAGHALASSAGKRFQKLRSIGTLATSAIVFTLYFLALGLILREFGVSLTAYLASASVIGLVGDEARVNTIEATATRLMGSIHKQFPGIFVYPPSSEGRLRFGDDTEVLRLKFRIWPNR